MPVFSPSPRQPGPGWRIFLPVLLSREDAMYPKAVLFLAVLVMLLMFLMPGKATHAATCGVIKNPDGTYTYQQLHVAGSQLENSAGCVVRLLGVNGVNAEASTGGNLDVVTFSSALPINNVVRIALNERWYVANVNVPKRGMSYQTWIDTAVQALKANGDYVILDADTAFFELPCANASDPTCPQQGQGITDYNNSASPYYHNPYQLEESQGIAVKALTLLAQRYGSDPAVLFDVWNEPAGYIFVIPNTQQYRAAWMDERINTVQKYSANPVVVFEAGDAENLSHTQPNLVFDFHVYPPAPQCGTSGPNWTNLDEHMATVYNAGRATIIGEWGGCDLIAGSTYNDPLMAEVKKYESNMAYYDFQNLHNGYSPNANGQLEQQDYQTL